MVRVRMLFITRMRAHKTLDFIKAAILVCLVSLCIKAAAEEADLVVSNQDEPDATIGQRPYEMDWAGRLKPEHEQLVNFEDLSGWHLRCIDGADAKAYRSRQEMLFGEYTAKVVYTGISEKSRFVLEPPKPIAIPQPCDAVNLWVRGNTWSWINPPKTAQTEIFVLLCDKNSRSYRIRMGVNNFDYWFLFQTPLFAPDGKTPLYAPVEQPNEGILEKPVFFTGIEITGCWNKDPARLYFDALSFYEMKSPPLTFNTMSKKPGWPTTPDTILPTTNKERGCSPTFSYVPSDGTLGDLYVTIDGQAFQPCLKGGIRFEINGRVLLSGDPDFTPRFTGERMDGKKHRYNWELTVGDVTLQYAFSLEVKGKSCIIDVTAEGGQAVQFDIGLQKGLPGAKTVQMPYLTYSWDGWPRVVCGKGNSAPIFLLALMDYYNSDASELFGPADLTAPESIGYTGGARYKPTTAGTRNPMRERLFVNVSTDLQEVLPNIPNPDCDTGKIARECLCNNLGDTSYPFPYDLLRKYKAYGIDKYIANHHEKLWRLGNESFTLRDRPAPEIGEKALVEYGTFVKSLGYRFGLYQNYTDLAPVSAAWDEDAVCRNPDGTWKIAWPRTYALKPLRSTELQAEFGRRVHARYGTTASCIDVHTALAPWERTDYDARTPGAGMFRTQFNAYGQLLLNESKIHGGPAISEGNYHWFYSGLVDGSYATILPFGSGHETPPLVDFDLLKMHPKMTDLGMGSPFCFYGFKGEWTTGASRLSQSFDRFMVSTIAYGHIGYLTEPWGFDGTLKSYYLIQALQQRYVMVPVKSIRYFDGINLLDTSSAIMTDAYKRGQIRTEYKNGLTTWCNLSFTDTWTVIAGDQTYLLPPASFVAYKANDILAYSANVNGLRHELVVAHDYLYLDSRDQAVSTPMITAQGTVAIKPDGKRVWWIIPALQLKNVTVSRAWLHVNEKTAFQAIACDAEGREIRPIPVQSTSHGVMIEPESDPLVVKYRLTALL